MSERVKRHILCLQMLNRNKNTKLRNAVLANADADLVCSLYECAYNILKGNVKLTKGQKKNSESTESIYNCCPRNKRLQRRRGISCKLVDSCRLCRVDPSTIAETVCGSVDGARQKVGIGRPAICGEFVSASADYDYDTCPN